MKVYLLKNIPKVGLAGEVINVKDGYAKNFLFPQKAAIEVSGKRAQDLEAKAKKIENRKEVIASETSVLSEMVKNTKITIRRKTHDNDKLYAAVNANDIVEALAEKDIKISKSQVIFDKAIKAKGTYKVIIKLTVKLQPELTVQVTS
jgi:large subunit ribosomal protein L9